MKPVHESCYFLLNEKGEPVNLIRNRIIYAIDPLDDEGIACTYNGNDALPLISSALGKLPDPEFPLGKEI